MSVFEFVFGLYSILLSLGITHLLSGIVEVLRNVQRVRFSLEHGLWAWSAFAMSIGNWASLWELRLLPAWPAWTVLLLIAVAVGQYAFCAFVTPVVREEGEIDLVLFHERARRGYAGALIVTAIISTLLNVVLGGMNAYSEWMRDIVLTGPAVVGSLLAFVVEATWAQRLGAILVAMMTTYFLVAASGIGVQ
ncbi:MAG: hypothetical protein ABL973_00405 [Micropepsaceae bacterium]